MAKQWLLTLFVVSLMSQAVPAQALPQSLKRYLDRSFRGWKLAGECYPEGSENKQVVTGNFDGNGKEDYAVKFVRGRKGFFMAFLAIGNNWRPFYLHIWDDPKNARFSDLILFERGDKYELGESNFKLKFDAPADFRCESDVGGIHVYKNGKFIAY